FHQEERRQNGRGHDHARDHSRRGGVGWAMTVAGAPGQKYMRVDAYMARLRSSGARTTSAVRPNPPTGETHRRSRRASPQTRTATGSAPARKAGAAERTPHTALRVPPRAASADSDAVPARRNRPGPELAAGSAPPP